jgi:uncharacterized integral membrane protein (TIGR00698 family)
MNYSKIVFIAALSLCALPFVDTPTALLTGIIFSQIFENPFLNIGKKLTTWLLQIAVVGLGFGMNAAQAFEVGKDGFVFTLVSIVSTITLGILIGRKLKIERKTSYLISTGTAVCGGSAIAAVSSIINPGEKQISTALGTVFILNSLALFLFPWIGHLLNLSQHQFGVWAAIAIHDTSSVVGAAGKFGEEALQTATTIKLERALWIIPVAFFTSFIFPSGTKKIKIPYFIFLFVLAMLINTYIPALNNQTHIIFSFSKVVLKITLFLIGAGLTRDVLKSAGIKPLLQGTIVWLFISVISLSVICFTVL